MLHDPYPFMDTRNHQFQSALSPYTEAAYQQLERMGSNPLADSVFSKYLLGDARGREYKALDEVIAQRLKDIPAGRGHEDQWGPIVSQAIVEANNNRELHRHRLKRLVAHLPERAKRWADLDERQIRAEVIHLDLLITKNMIRIDDIFGRPPRGGAAVSSTLRIRWMQRQIRKSARQYREAIALVAGIVGAHGQHYTSDMMQRDRKNQREAQARWMAATMIVNKETGESRPLSEIVSADGGKRIAEWVVVSRGIEELAQEKGMSAVFMTLTAPPEFHPNPTSRNRDRWNGASPLESHQWISKGWQKFRANLSSLGIKNYFIRTAEPHKDSCTHWHMMIYVAPCDVARLKKLALNLFGHSEKAVKIVDIHNQNGSSPTGYMFKHLQTALDGENRVEAWQATWKIRAVDSGGLPKGARTLWRLARSASEQLPDWAKPAVHAAKENDFAEFCRQIQRNEITTAKKVLKRSGDNPGDFYTVTRYPGLKHKPTGSIIATKRDQYAFVTDQRLPMKKSLDGKPTSLGAGVTVIHSNPRELPPPDDSPDDYGRELAAVA